MYTYPFWRKYDHGRSLPKQCCVQSWFLLVRQLKRDSTYLNCFTSAYYIESEEYSRRLSYFKSETV